MEVLGEFAKYAFFGLKRKRRDFERSVLRYVSIKISALTHSGRKRRGFVNQPDRLSLHPTMYDFAALRARGFAIRQSLGRLRGVRQGGAGYGAAPPSLPPLHPPRSTPKERFQFPSCGEGNAAFAAGASLPRSARSGDLPPRRVNARVHFCLGCYSVSAIIR